MKYFLTSLSTFCMLFWYPVVLKGNKLNFVRYHRLWIPFYLPIHSPLYWKSIELSILSTSYLITVVELQHQSIIPVWLWLWLSAKVLAKSSSESHIIENNYTICTNQNVVYPICNVLSLNSRLWFGCLLAWTIQQFFWYTIDFVISAYTPFKTW